MKYIALIYAAEGSGPQPGTPEFEKFMGGYFALNEKAKADGVWVAGEPLEAVSTATSLRKRGGKMETMDGPFAETKEHLGGFYVFDCENLDEAIKYAAMIPTIEYGTIEVRPLMVIPGDG